MTYQVLARKWRPQSFNEVAVQVPTIKVLQHSLDSQKLHHAYLFTGTRGVGKTTLARILAKALVCAEGVSSTPCNQCALCKAVTDGTCIDVIEIDAASKTKVEDTRLLLDNLAYAPSMARFKIYIIDEVHMLSNHSFNALLKSLEEPPNHVKFLLATTDPQKLPITVLSRCLQFKLRAFCSYDIIEQLEKILRAENKLFEEPAILQLALAANGSMRDALSLLEKVLAFNEEPVITQSVVATILGIPDFLQLINLLQAVLNADVVNILSIINSFVTASLDLAIVLQEIQVILKNIAILQIILDPKHLPEEMILHKDLLLNLAKNSTREEIQLFYDIAVNGFKNLAFTPDPRVWLEMIMLRMVAFVPVNTIDPVNLSNQEFTSDIKNNNIDFHNIIKQSNISGLTRELAENSVFELADEGAINLLIDENNKLLVTKNNLENLQNAFNKYFNKNINVKVIFKNFTKESHLAQATVRCQKQAELQQFINQDQTLQDLLTTFDGQVEIS